MHRISFFDMDKTITREATFAPFLRYVIPRHKPWRAVFLPLVGLATAAYGLRLIDRAKLKEINVSLLMGRKVDAAHFSMLSEGFARETVARNALEGAVQRIASEREEGRRVVLATASYALYVEAVAALLDVDDVIATRTQGGEGWVSSRIDGENCYGDGKLRMVSAWLSEQGIAREDAHIRFFSDHVSDAVAMEWSDEAFATNPHGALRRLAQERGWTILDWR